VHQDLCACAKGKEISMMMFHLPAMVDAELMVYINGGKGVAHVDNGMALDGGAALL
jgi:hypothetical protein